MTAAAMDNTARVWKRSMVGRDPAEEHRASTPLELLFDLCFVVAVSQAAESLHRGLVDPAVSVHHSLIGYFTVFFAIWWAWMNFTWFASAYDTDDIPYRLLTFLQISGVLVLAAGVARAFNGDFAVITFGYVIMRVAMTAQWLRAAASHHEGRATAQRYALALVLTQIGWLGRLLLPDSTAYYTFVILVVLEVLTPYFSERKSRSTSWHPDHIAERYGLFTIIVLGECILRAFEAINEGITNDGVSAHLLVVAGSGLVIVFGLWWNYFRIPAGEMLKDNPSRSFLWGYAHYFLFASIAALGAGITVAAESGAAHDAVGHEAVTAFRLSDTGVGLVIGIPVGVALLLMTLVRALAFARRRADVIGCAAAALVVLAGASANAIGLEASLVSIAAIIAAKVAIGIVDTADEKLGHTTDAPSSA